MRLPRALDAARAPPSPVVTFLVARIGNPVDELEAAA
jgi:hypothetical protein